MNSKHLTMWMMLAVLAACTTARAAVEVQWNPSGLAVDPEARTVITFDPAPGNALAVGGNTAVENFILNLGDGGNRDTSFVTYYQAIVASTSDDNGPNTPGGLNNSYQYTVVARLVEEVIGVTGTAGRGTADFAWIPGDSYFEMFHDTVLNASNVAGTGFNDGTRVLGASVTELTSSFSIILDGAGNPIVDNLDNFGTNNYPGQMTLQGSGDVRLTARITYIDNNYFPDLLLSDEIVLTLNFPSNLVVPYNQVNPSAAFLVNSTTTAVGQVPVAAGAGAPLDAVYGIGSVNADSTSGNGGPSVQEQVDGSFSINRQPAAIPEPGAVVIWGLLAAGGLGYRLRRKQRVGE